MGEARHAGEKYVELQRAQPIKQPSSPKPFQPQRNGCTMGSARSGMLILCRFSRASPILRTHWLVLGSIVGWVKRGTAVKNTLKYNARNP
jgi:hypothetical protein